MRIQHIANLNPPFYIILYCLIVTLVGCNEHSVVVMD